MRNGRCFPLCTVAAIRTLVQRHLFLMIPSASGRNPRVLIHPCNSRHEKRSRTENQRLHGKRRITEKMNRKAHAACRNCSGRRLFLSSGAFRSKFPFGLGLGQTEKLQNYPSEKVRKMQKIRLKPDGFNRIWSECRDLNPRPLGPEPSAIPNFATPRDLGIIVNRNGFVKCRGRVFYTFRYASSRRVVSAAARKPVRSAQSAAGTA